MLQSEALERRTAKYLLIDLAETMANRLQHILAQQKGLTVTGYMDAITKGCKEGIISEGLFRKLKPFFEFRTNLGLLADDKNLMSNIQASQKDLIQLSKELDLYINQQTQQTQ